MVLKKTKTKLGKSKRTKKRTQRGGKKPKPKTFAQIQEVRHRAERATAFAPKQSSPEQSFGSNPLTKFFYNSPNKSTQKPFGINPLKKFFGISPKPVTPLKKNIVPQSYEPNSQVKQVSSKQPLYAVVHPTSTPNRPFAPYEVPVHKTQKEEGTYADLINPNKYKATVPQYEEFVHSNPNYIESVPVNKGSDDSYLNVNPKIKFSERVAHLPKTANVTNSDYVPTSNANTLI